MCRFFNFPLFVLAPFVLFLTVSPTVTSALLPLPTHTVYQFPNLTWVENIAVRSNGGILVTLLSSPDVYLIDAAKSSALLVHTFPSYLGLFGIAELEHDIFYVVVGDVNVFTQVTIPQRFSVWEVDMREFSHSGANVRKVTDMPEALALNGLAALSIADSTVIIADAVLGGAWTLNVKTGSYFVSISDPTMADIPTAFLPLGINGVKVRDGHLFFTNSNQGLFCSVPISTAGKAKGEVTILATGLIPDDFALDSSGKAWIAQNTINVVTVLFGNGTLVNVAGATDQLTIAGPTSCAFGRGRKGKGQGKGKSDCGTLYCSTTGGLAGPVNGTAIEGGKVVAIKTEGLGY